MSAIDERQDQFIRLYTANGSAIRGFVRSLVPTREDGADDAPEVPVRIRPARLLPRVAPRFAVAACVAAAAVVAVLGLLQRPASLSPVTFTRIEVIDSTRDSDYSSGQLLSESHIAVDQGRITLQLDGGPTLDLSAPAEVEILDGMHVRVLGGDVTVNAGDRGTGFIVDTILARVVDLGTRFAVSVGQAGETDVVVLEGEIEVHEPPGSARASPYVKLMAGDALTVTAPNFARRLTAVTMEPRVTRLDRAARLGVVTGVSDNVTDPDYRRFYGLVPGGMRDDQLAYTTIGRARWRPVAGQEFPAELLGADTVRTFHDDRDSRNLEIALEVGQPRTPGQPGNRAMYGIAVQPL